MTVSVELTKRQSAKWRGTFHSEAKRWSFRAAIKTICVWKEIKTVAAQTCPSPQMWCHLRENGWNLKLFSSSLALKDFLKFMAPFNGSAAFCRIQKLPNKEFFCAKLVCLLYPWLYNCQLGTWYTLASDLRQYSNSNQQHLEFPSGLASQVS